MKSALRILKRVLIITGVITIVIFAIRLFNEFRYSAIRSSEPSVYDNPTDISLYPTDIEGVDVKHIEGEYLNGFHLKPHNKTTKGVVVIFGGSEGSTDYYTAVGLAQNGYEVLSLFFFGMPNQQPTLADVPLEFFEEVLTYIYKNVEDQVLITVYGTSKGAELVLNLANYYPEIDNIVLVAPSAYNFSGLDFSKMTSSWTYQGKPLPYISTTNGNFLAFGGLMIQGMTNSPIEYEPLYSSAIAQEENIEEKLIIKETIDVNMLVIAGTDDKVWPSAAMTEVIKERQNNYIDVHIYEGAGHLFQGDGIIVSPQGAMSSGGTQEVNEAAYARSSSVIKQTLDRWHKN